MANFLTIIATSVFISATVTASCMTAHDSEGARTLAVSAAGANSPYPSPLMTTTANAMINTCQPLAAQIGLNVLQNGGNAAEAFIATVFADYVTEPGVTLLAGPLQALIYTPARNGSPASTIYLNAGLMSLLEPDAQYSQAHPDVGRKFLVPGAPLGLQGIYDKFHGSTLAFADLMQPAINLATAGYDLTQMDKDIVQGQKARLETSAAWSQIYLDANGQANSHVVQPDLAATLQKIATQGAAYFYQGDFAQHLVTTVQANGGKLTLQDLSSYQVTWSPPLTGSYRGYQVATSSGRSIGGLNLLLGLKILEASGTVDPSVHYSANVDLLEKFFRIQRQAVVATFPFYANGTDAKLDDPSQVQAVLDTAPSLWATVQAQLGKGPAPSAPDTGSHSCETVIVDPAGNIVVGNHTSYSSPWGDGVYVDGAALNSAYQSGLYTQVLGDRIIDAINPILVFKDDQPLVAAAFFATGMDAAGFQTIVDLLDYNLPPDQAQTLPRWGTPTGGAQAPTPLDPRFPTSWLAMLAARGLNFSQTTGDPVDTGLATLVRFDPTQHLIQGMPPAYYFPHMGRLATDAVAVGF